MSELLAECRKIVKCDKMRISKPMDKMFLIIGFNRNTVNDSGQWVKNGEPIDFDYTEEHVVASGYTKDELLDSAREYARLEGMSALEYIMEQRSKGQ